MTTLLTLLLSLPAAPAREGPAHVTVDLVRVSPDSPRIFIEVELPNGEPGLMMIDTGADVSVLSPRVAARLDLGPHRTLGTVQGITSTANVEFARLPTLRIGNLELHEVEVAIGVPGQADHFELLPVVGILGNNVWSQWVLDLDYHAGRLALHRPGSISLPPTAAPLRFDGSHIHSPVRLHTESGDHTTVVLALDTAASELILLGSDGIPYDGPFDEGLEPVYGITSADGLPASSYLRRTRRLALDTVELGGRVVHTPFDARWLDWDRADISRTLAVNGLVGHEIFEGHRALIDYQGSRFALTRSRRPAGYTDGYKLLLQRDEQRFGDAPDRLLYRARLMLGLGETTEALGMLTRLLDLSDPSVLPLHTEARVLSARLRRLEGDLAGAWALLAPLSPAELVEAGEIMAVVDGLLLEGRGEEAEDVSRAAVGARSGSAEAWIARADVLLAQGLVEEAHLALQEAGRRDQAGDSQILRRLRVSVARGDHNGALATLREAVLDNPLDGRMLWFYALLADPDDRATAAIDLRDATASVHGRMLPLDFLAGAFHTLGDEDRAVALMREGVTRDCDPHTVAADRDNCVAWYFTLAGHRLDEALSRVERALAVDAHRPDYLDTLAMVQAARGEVAAARAAAIAAARLTPDDPYMLWQATRLGALDGQATPDLR